MKFRTTLLILAVFAMLSVGALASAQNNTVTMVLTNDPNTFDPQGAIDPGAPVLLAYVYDTLLFQTDDGRIEPYIAESWDIAEGGQSVTFHLRDDVVFSNGQPLNADAVIYTLERLKRVGQRSFIYSEIMNITHFDKPDDYTVTFNLAQPSSTLLSALTYTYAAILEPGAVEGAGEAYGHEPVGSGPFMIADWTPQNNMRLVRNPNYNGHRPLDIADQPTNIDEMNIRFTRDQSARISALLTGEIDMAYITSAPQLARIADNPDFTIMDNPTRGLIIAGFNTGRAPFDNVLMRQAVAQAIRKQEILDIAAEGLGVVVHSPIAPSIFGHNPALETEALTYDQDAAVQLMEEAGYGSGAEISILTSNFPSYQTMATILQAQLLEIGIRSTIEIQDFAAVREIALSGEYDIVLTRYDWNDPDLLRIYLGTESLGRGNRYAYSNPQLDALLTQGRQEFDPEVRFEIYTEAQRIVMQDIPWVMLHMPITKVVMSNRLTNVGLHHSHVVLDNATVN